MTRTYGWDTSDFDGNLTAAIMAKAKAEGISFVTHKLTEGTSNKHVKAGAALAAARDAGIPILGGYHVVRSGPSPAAQVAYCIAYADDCVPWWRDFPGWFWQVDLEIWSYDNVPASAGIAFGQQLRAATGRGVVMYASRGEYGDKLAAWDGPLWNANYGTNPHGQFAAVYPGDDSAGWKPYSGRTPAILQYGSNTTIAGCTTSDANAFKGSVDDLLTLIGADMTTVDLTPGAIAAIQAAVWGHIIPNGLNRTVDLAIGSMDVRTDATTNKQLPALAAAVAADAKVDAAIQAALAALTAGGTSVDTAAIQAAIKTIGDTESKAVSALSAQLATEQASVGALAAQLAALRNAIAAGDIAAAAALAAPTAK